MTPFPHLDAEQEAMAAVLSGCRSGDWIPLMPLGLETLRTSVSPGATRWTDP